MLFTTFRNPRDGHDFMARIQKQQRQGAAGHPAGSGKSHLPSIPAAQASIAKTANLLLVARPLQFSRIYSMGMEAVTVRFAAVEDIPALAAMLHALWPEGSLEEHATELHSLLTDPSASTLPVILLVAERNGHAVGFLEAGLRSHADGCDTRQPVGFIEGWYVEPAARLQGVGARLVTAAEAWARSQGCKEMASDTWLDNAQSQSAHQALGFEVVDRCVHYRKNL